MPSDILKPIVLIVEDDSTIREMVCMILESSGYAAESACDGLEGLERFLATRPDLVILDVRMPRMDGWQTLEEIRRRSDCPVVMLTAFGSTSDLVRGLKAGADDYLRKPFGADELVARVDAVLRRSSVPRVGSDP